DQRKAYPPQKPWEQNSIFCPDLRGKYPHREAEKSLLFGRSHAKDSPNHQTPDLKCPVPTPPRASLRTFRRHHPRVNHRYPQTLACPPESREHAVPRPSCAAFLSKHDPPHFF